LALVPTSDDYQETLVRLSTRNQLTGTITAIDPGSVMTVVKIALDGGQEVTSSITKDAAEDLGLTVGMPVTTLIKSTEVMLAVE
jgi:molybdopterin-binding protein